MLWWSLVIVWLVVALAAWALLIASAREDNDHD